MTELGAVFLLALATQGYTWHVDRDDDLVIARKGYSGSHRVPMVALRDPMLAPLLAENIDYLMFLENGRFVWPPTGSGRN